MDGTRTKTYFQILFSKQSCVRKFSTDREIETLESNKDDNFDFKNPDNEQYIENNSVFLESDHKKEISEEYSQSSIFGEIMTVIDDILLLLKVDAFYKPGEGMPYDFFKLLFNNIFLGLLIDETNRYA